MGWVGLDWVVGRSGHARLREVAKSWALLEATGGEQLDRPCNVWQEASYPKMAACPNFASLRPHLRRRLVPCVVAMCTFLSIVDTDHYTVIDLAIVVELILAVGLSNTVVEFYCFDAFDGDISAEERSILLRYR